MTQDAEQDKKPDDAPPPPPPASTGTGKPELERPLMQVLTEAQKQAAKETR